MSHETERKAQIRNKRKNAQKLDIRQSISEEQFCRIINSVKNNHFVPSRKKAALVLLYITGLKISNLLVLKLYNIDELFNKYSKL